MANAKAVVKIGIVGAAGRMGQAVIRQVAETEGCTLTAACEVSGSAAVGADAGERAGISPSGVIIGDDTPAVFGQSEAVIEFSTPAASIEHATIAAESGTVHVIGTTGLDFDQSAALSRAGQSTPIVWAPNMSLAANILFALSEQVARLLDEDFDIEIVEMHHRHKVDAPSGTALALGRAAAAGRGVALDQVAVRGRDGVTGPRRRGDIGFAVLRGGDVVGDHTVSFAADGERLELSHKAAGRQIFARGAVRAALWAKDQPSGLYSMANVLGLE